MAHFKCKKCGYSQEAPDEQTGQNVQCPSCNKVGTVTAAKEVDRRESHLPCKPVAPKAETASTRLAQLASRQVYRVRTAAGNLMHLRPSLLGVLTALVGSSVVLQGLTLLELKRDTPIASQSVTQVESASPLQVEIVDSCEIDVTLAGERLIGGLPVTIDGESLITPLPVSIDRISSTSELDVKLQNHWITRGDPIPVKIVN